MALKKDIGMRESAQNFMTRDISKELDEKQNNRLRSEHIAFLTSPDIAKKLKAVATLKQITVSTLIENIVRDALAADEYDIQKLKAKLLEEI